MGEVSQWLSPSDFLESFPGFFLPVQCQFALCGPAVGVVVVGNSRCWCFFDDLVVHRGTLYVVDDVGVECVSVLSLGQ